MQKSPYILVGLKEITEYVGVTKLTLYNLVKTGFPATTINGKWYAHINNIEKYFERVTMIRPNSIDENAE